eukprot:tig00000093_g3508.t1
MSEKGSGKAAADLDVRALVLQAATDPWLGAVITMLWGFIARRWLAGFGAKIAAKLPERPAVRAALLALVTLPVMSMTYADFTEGGLLFLYVLGPLLFSFIAATVESIALLLKRFRAAIVPYCPIPLVILLSALLQASLWVPILLVAYGLLASGVLYPGRAAVKYMIENDVLQSAAFREFAAWLDAWFRIAVQGNFVMFLLSILRAWVASWLYVDIWRLPILFHLLFVRPGFIKQHLLGVAILVFWIFDSNAQPLTTTVIAMSFLIYVDKQLFGERPPSRPPFQTGAIPPVAFARALLSHLPGAAVFWAYCLARSLSGGAPSLLSVFAWFVDLGFALVCISAAVSSLASARSEGLSWRHAAFGLYVALIFFGKVGLRFDGESARVNFGDGAGGFSSSYGWSEGDWSQRQGSGAGGRRAGGKRYGTIWDRWTNSDMEALRLLKLESGAPNEEIVKACRREKKRWHPDKNPRDQERATRMFQKIAGACDLLLKNS